MNYVRSKKYMVLAPCTVKTAWGKVKLDGGEIVLLTEKTAKRLMRNKKVVSVDSLIDELNPAELIYFRCLDHGTGLDRERRELELIREIISSRKNIAIPQGRRKEKNYHGIT